MLLRVVTFSSGGGNRTHILWQDVGGPWSRERL
jgi:hypothetical protein